MPIDITINDITGQTPYDIYICDTGSTTCIYVSTINVGDLPYDFTVPPFFTNLDRFNLKIIDDNNCQINEILIT
jgi:hypothetical protein